MLYAYEGLSPAQFEGLTLYMCRRLFGQSVQSFADGKDGGRDAKFHGLAEKWPSSSAGWNGKVVIQAKHTSGTNTSFSETDFHSDKSSNTIIGKEILRIKKLLTDKDLEFYFLISNRRLTALKESVLIKHISKETGLAEQNISILGLEFLENFFERKFRYS